MSFRILCVIILVIWSFVNLVILFIMLHESNPTMPSPQSSENGFMRSKMVPRSARDTDRDAEDSELFLREPSFPAEPSTPADLTDVDELAPGEYDPAVEDRREVMAAIDALRMSNETDEEGEWEKRMHLLRLINYIAEQESQDSLASQARRVVELMNTIPENEPVDSKAQSTIINLADKCLDEARRLAKAA